MAFLFAGSELGDFDVGGTVTSSTTTAHFDTNYARAAISIAGAAGQPNYIFSTFAGQADLWCRFAWVADNASATANTYACLLMAGANNVCRVSGKAASIVAVERWDGSAWVEIAEVAFAANVRYHFTIRARIGGSGGFDLWSGTTLIASYSGDTAALGNVTEVRLSMFRSSSNIRFSEIIGATHNIRDARLKTLNLTGAGAVSEWTGSVTDINAAGSATGTFISEDTAGQISTFAAADLFADSLDVDAVIISGTVRKNATGPTGVDGIVRVGSTNYGEAFPALAEGFEPRSVIFATNPATSAPWARAAVDALEIGVRAAA